MNPGNEAAQLVVNWLAGCSAGTQIDVADAAALEAQITARIEARSGWRAQLDQRQRQEVTLALMYRNTFNHGTDGHGRLVLIATLADLLDGVG